ncbi:pleckstrin homology domain-containing family S member 1-like isoform 2-T2 [Pholidichthys leucotaenia]
MQRVTGGSTVFYKQAKVVKEIRSGYLYKSPPKRVMTEWKKRYFVLFELSEHEHQLKYFTSPEDKNRPLGDINLSQITTLSLSPQYHQKWGSIQKNFKCSPNCVLYIRVGSRDYFLVGENSEEVEGWYSDLYEALKSKPHNLGSSEDLPNGKVIKTISKPQSQDEERPPGSDQVPFKIRSMSEPSSNAKDSDSEKPKEEDFPKRRASEPVNPIYDYPRPLRQKVEKQNGEQCNITDGIDHEVEDVITGTLMKSVTQAFERIRAQISPLPVCEEEIGREETHQSSDFSCSSGATSPPVSPVNMLASSSESLDPIDDRDIEVKKADLRKRFTLVEMDKNSSLDRTSPEERNMEVNQADLKKHLTLTDMGGKPSVSGWTGQPQSVCLFHKGDQILAVNDLHVGNVTEFDLFLSRSLKNEVKVTILRHPGHQPLHLPNSTCTDWQPNDH